MSNLFITAVKRHALACSKAHRGGRFERVGESFLTELEVDVETLVRQIQNKYPDSTHAPLQTDESFVTPDLLERIRVEVNHAIARMIQAKIARHASVGKTLGRTR